MLLIARKNLFSERIRLLISVGGVAISVLLITLLLSLYRGWNEKIGGFIDDVNVDVWIALDGTTDFLRAASVLPIEETGRQLEGVDGVQSWSPLIVRSMTAYKGDSEIDISLVGYNPADGIGGPVEIVDGPDDPGPGEMIVDESLKSRYGLRIGDMLDAAGVSWKVVGISSGGDFVATHVVFTNFDEAQAALNMDENGLTSFMAVKLTDPADSQRVADNLDRIYVAASVTSREEFAANTRERALGNVLPILLVILVLAFIVGLAVSGLTIYTATVEKAREYGILKAVGFTNGYLYRLVFEQSFVTAFLGFVFGVSFTLAVAPFLSDLVPQFVVFVRWQDILIVAASTIIMALLSGYVPVRRLAGIDPTSVFKA